MTLAWAPCKELQLVLSVGFLPLGWLASWMQASENGAEQDHG